MVTNVYTTQHVLVLNSFAKLCTSMYVAKPPFVQHIYNLSLSLRTDPLKEWYRVRRTLVVCVISTE